MTGKFDILKEYFYGSAPLQPTYQQGNENSHRVVRYLNFIRNKIEDKGIKFNSDADAVLHTNSKSSDLGQTGGPRVVEILKEIEAGRQIADRAGELATLIHYGCADYFDFEELKRMGVELRDRDLKRFKYLFDNHQLAVSTLIAMGG